MRSSRSTRPARYPQLTHSISTQTVRLTCVPPTCSGFDPTQLGQPITGNGAYGLTQEKNGTIAQIAQNGSISTPLQRRSIFVKAHYDINDQIQAYTQANFAHVEVHTFSAGPPPAVGGAWGGSIPNTPGYDTAVIPSALQTLLNSRPDPTANWQLNRGLDFLGGFGPSNSSDVFQVLAGLKGSFKSNDWTWDVYASTVKPMRPTSTRPCLRCSNGRPWWARQTLVRARR